MIDRTLETRPPSPHDPDAADVEHTHDYGRTWYAGPLPRCTDPTHPAPEPNTEPPCIAGDHYPNDAGDACYYCGLPAEPGDPQELAEALYYTLQLAQDRDRWSEALAGGAAARTCTLLTLSARSYPDDMPAQLAALARWRRADRIERNA
jgi:hypothetical protein